MAFVACKPDLTYNLTPPAKGAPVAAPRQIRPFAPIPDANEPVYTPGVSTLVFQDGFDSYHLPVDGSGTPNQATFPTTARMQTLGTYDANPANCTVGQPRRRAQPGAGKSLRSNNTRGRAGGGPLWER